MALATRAISVAFLAAIIPLLYYRIPAFWLFYANHPSRMPHISNIDYEIKFADIIRNCEDAFLDEKSGVAIISCDPGRDKWNTIMGTFIDENDARGTLYSYKYTDPEAHPVPLKFEKLPSTLPKAIHPLGVAFHPPTRTLYTISHVHPPSILVFKLSSDGTAATFKRRITHPLLQTPNSITPISDHEVYVTNDHFFKIAELRLLAQAETYLAYPGGSVVYYDLSTDTAKKVANIPFANGVALLPTGRLAVASTTTPAVFIYDVDPASHELSLNLTLKPQFLVDNLKTDSAGMLYLAGHPYAPALEEAAKANNEYDVDGTGAPGLKPEAERPRAGSWVAEWDGNAEGALRDLYAGWEYGCSATAVRDPKVNLGLVTGLYERGVMVWREKKG